MGTCMCSTRTARRWCSRRGPDARVVARNHLDERALASPAIAHGRIYIRTDLHLFAIGAKLINSSSDRESAQSGGASGWTVAICVAKTAGSVVGRSQMRFSQT